MSGLDRYSPPSGLPGAADIAAHSRTEHSRTLNGMHGPPGPHDPDGEVMAAMLVASPSFKDGWDRHLADWAQDDGRGPYLDVAEFARHLVQLLEADRTEEFPAVFDEVEQLLARDDAGIRSVLVVGLLEGLGNLGANKHDWPFAARFRQWFGPATSAAWDDLHRFWGTSDMG